MSTTIKHVDAAIPPAESFVPRHVGPDEKDVAEMLKTLGFASLDELIDATIPKKIRWRDHLDLPKGLTELEVLTYFRALAAKNQVFRSFIGMGYSDTVTPPVVQRNILENPGWYTAYTPYQAEIAQGRLEALLNFQTMVSDLTALPIANASLLDEGTAAAEAMTMSYALKGKPGKEVFLVASECHPQTIDVVKTRAGVRGIEVKVTSYADFKIGPEVFGVLVQYPATDGAVIDYTKTVDSAHAADALVTVAADILSLVLLTPPGEWGADIVVGNTQRFGVPLGYGGPHAAYFATRDDFKRHLPGRIIGLSRDADGKPALRMALQTREQHIRREKDEQRLHGAGAAGGGGEHVRRLSRAAGTHAHRASRARVRGSAERRPAPAWLHHRPRRFLRHHPGRCRQAEQPENHRRGAGAEDQPPLHG